MCEEWKAFALSIEVAESLIEPLYLSEFGVGSDPLVVYRMLAALFGCEIVMVTEPEYRPLGLESIGGSSGIPSRELLLAVPGEGVAEYFQLLAPSVDLP